MSLHVSSTNVEIISIKYTFVTQKNINSVRGLIYLHPVVAVGGLV